MSGCQRYLRPLESVTKPSLSDPSFFYKIGLKMGVFFYKIGLKGVFSSFGYSNLMINRDPCSVKNSGQYSFV